MSGTRLQEKSTPITQRFPKWALEHYYQQGAIVFRDHDSDEIDLYVALVSHTSNDSDYCLIFNDSDNDSDFVFNANVWIRYKSSRILDSDEMSFAALTNRYQHLALQFDSDKSYIDSDIGWINEKLPLLPDSDRVDSELRLIRQRIDAISGRAIFDFVDSEAKHNQILVWDSDTQILVTKMLLRRLNTFGPDASGNIPISFIKVLSGNTDQRPDSETDGTIYIITNDSDSEVNGFSYIFNVNNWVPIVSPDRNLYDSKFLKVDGSNKLTGPLYTDLTYTNGMELVNKKYVDLYVKNSKQDQFGLFDSENVIDTSIFDSENFIVTRDTPSIKFFDNININNIGNAPVSDFEYFSGANLVSNLLTVYTANFSSFVTGTLQFYRNGSFEPFGVFASDNGTTSLPFGGDGSGTAPDFRLVDSSSQQFIVSMDLPWDVADEFVLKYTSHQGDVTKLINAANDSDWLPPAEDIDYGTY